jgi:hypothetical protein
MTSRGNLIAVSRSRKAATAMMTVAMPAVSSKRATCPTDTWQTGQTGTSTAASTACAWSNSTHFGPVCLSKGSCAQAPTKE